MTVTRSLIRSKRLITIALIGIIFIIAITLGVTLYFRQSAPAIGDELGNSMGLLVGKAIGSLEGMTDGRTKGTEAGKTAGMSAEDTEAHIANEISQVKNLEVLVASVKLSNFHQIGETVQYAALYVFNGNIVFSVDLSKASIKAQDGEMHIILPKPGGNLYIDEGTVDKVAEYQRKWFSGSAEDGFDIYLNTMREVQMVSEEKLVNYEELLNDAKQAAERQVMMLVQSSAPSISRVSIEFAD